MKSKYTVMTLVKELYFVEAEDADEAEELACQAEEPDHVEVVSRIITPDED